MIDVIVGTNRAGSSTRQLALRVQGIYQELNLSVRLIDLMELPAEIYQPDAYAEKPPAFRPFSEAILEAHGLVVVTPEYNGSMPGALKYFIDMLKFPESFQEKPVCFIGLSAGFWGGLRPVEHLQQIFGYRNAHLFPERVFLSRAHELLNASGELIDEEVDSRLKRQATGFARFIERLKHVRLLAEKG